MYGPSLPTLIKVNNPNIYQDEKDPKMIAPINLSGIKFMSYGFAYSGKTSIMRGPMVSN